MKMYRDAAQWFVKKDLPMSPRKRNIVTGTVVLVALLTLAWMILTFSAARCGFFRPKGVRVVFRSERADGLSEGSPVFFKGVEVGKITRVRRMEDNEHVLIEGELDNHPPLPQNLQGDIKAQSSLSSSCEVDLTTRGPATGTLAAARTFPFNTLAIRSCRLNSAS